MTGAKTNERPGTRATLRGYQMSASKARVVLNIVRGEDVNTAREILAGTTREAADVIGKLLASAVANAVNNDGMQADELYVSAAFADEGITMKRFSPRARGRAGKIFKRSTHITVIVSRMDEERLEHMRTARNAQAQASRSRRVASSRRRADQTASVNKREAAHEAQAELDAAEALAAENAVVEEITPDDVIADTVLEAGTEAEAPGLEAAIAAEDQDAASDFAVEDDSVSEDTTEETN
ncbi:MAG: 50S ribosomal protein L22 [Acidimicrobiales bacterium]|jgi:large subunit ribosomal protein L22